MNVARGLFRAWIVVSLLWIVGAGSLAYVIVSPDTVKGSFQPAGYTKGGLKPWEVDYRAARRRDDRITIFFCGA